MAPITGTFDSLLLVADVTDDLAKSLVKPELRDKLTWSRLVFELGHQAGAGPPLMGMNFSEGKIQIPGLQLSEGIVMTYKSILWFDSRLMTYPSSAIGLRSVHASFEPTKFTSVGRSELSYTIKGVLEAEVRVVERQPDLEEAKTLMSSPWVGGSTGRHSYQHAFRLDELVSPSRSVEGKVRLHLPSITLEQVDMAEAVDGWLELPVRGMTVHAPWKLNGPTKLKA